MHNLKIRRRGASTVALVVAAALSVTACSSDSDSSSASGDPSTSGGSSACPSSVTDYLKPLAELPTKLAPTLLPLPAKPEPGGLIVKITNGNITGDVRSSKAMEAALKTVGWSFKDITFDGTPEDLNAKYEQAIAENPTAIATAGPPTSVYAKPLEEAQSKGIITVVNSAQETPDLDKGPQVINNGQQMYQAEGEANAYKFLAAVNCAPTKVMIVTLDFPALATMVAGFSDVIKKECPGCDMTTKTIQPADLGTPTATSSIVAALQADPDTKWVFASIGNGVDGLPPALSAANLSGIHIFGAVPSEQSVAALQNGSNDWWVTQSPEVDGWAMVHETLLAQQNGEAFELSSSALGYMTPDNIPSDATFPPSYPTDYDKQFEALWHVDG